MKIKDLEKIEIGDYVRTSSNGTWKKVTKKFMFGLELQEKEGYSKSSIDICYITDHKKENQMINRNVTKRNKVRTQVYRLFKDFQYERLDNIIDKIFDSGGINFEELDLNKTQYRTAKTITCVLAKVLHDDYYHFSVEDEIVNLYNLI